MTVGEPSELTSDMALFNNGDRSLAKARRIASSAECMSKRYPGKPVGGGGILAGRARVFDQGSIGKKGQKGLCPVSSQKMRLRQPHFFGSGVSFTQESSARIASMLSWRCSMK